MFCCHNFHIRLHSFAVSFFSKFRGLILKDLNPYKAAGIDNLSGKFLKNSTHVLGQPKPKLCNLSIKVNSFPRSCKIA